MGKNDKGAGRGAIWAVLILILMGAPGAQGYTVGQGLLSLEQAEQQARSVRGVLRGYMDRTGKCVSTADKVGYGGLLNLKDEEGTLHMNPPRSGFEVALFLRIKAHLVQNPGAKISLEDMFHMGLESCGSGEGRSTWGTCCCPSTMWCGSSPGRRIGRKATRKNQGGGRSET